MGLEGDSEFDPEVEKVGTEVGCGDKRVGKATVVNRTGTKEVGGRIVIAEVSGDKTAGTASEAGCLDKIEVGRAGKASGRLVGTAGNWGNTRGGKTAVVIRIGAKVGGNRSRNVTAEGWGEKTDVGRAGKVRGRTVGG